MAKIIFSAGAPIPPLAAAVTPLARSRRTPLVGESRALAKAEMQAATRAGNVQFGHGNKQLDATGWTTSRI